MKKFFRNQNGFGAVEGLIAVVLIALIVAVGYLAYKNHQEGGTTAITSTQSPTKSPATTQTPNPYAGWKTYTNSTYGVSFKYPSQWRVYSQPNGDSLGLYISQVTPAELQTATTSSSSDSNYLEVEVFMGKTYFGNGPNNPNAPTDESLGSLSYNGKSYSLIGETYNGSIVLVGLNNCPSGLGSCGEFMPTSKGGSITAGAYAVVREQNPTIPIDLNGGQYADASLIFKSLTF